MSKSINGWIYYPGDLLSGVHCTLYFYGIMSSGGAIRHGTYNESDSFDAATETGFVLSSTYFNSISHISHIELTAVIAGSIVVDVVKPVCGGGLFWSPETRSCELSSATWYLDYVGFERPCGGADNAFCSNEDTCFQALTCPPAALTRTPPSGYSVIAELGTFTFAAEDLNQKLVLAVNKTRVADVDRDNVLYRCNIVTCISL